MMRCWMHASVFTDAGTTGVRLQANIAWAAIGYDPLDPWAVWLDLGDGLPRWVFARELLRQGLQDGAGIGDVRVVPAATERRGRADRVRLELASDHGRCAVILPRADVVDALALTDQLVAPGDEAAQVRWDRELAALGVV